MTLEDMAYHIINESIHLANLRLDENYLMDFKKILYILFLVECEYMKQTNTPLFAEDFFLSASGIAVGVEKGKNFDISLSKYIEQKLFIFEDVERGIYTNPTFETKVDHLINDIVAKILNEYGFISLNLLKALFAEVLNLKGVYSFNLIEKNRMKSLFEDEVLNNVGISRIRELN